MLRGKSLHKLLKDKGVGSIGVVLSKLRPTDEQLERDGWVPFAGGFARVDFSEVAAFTATDEQRVKATTALADIEKLGMMDGWILVSYSPVDDLLLPLTEKYSLARSITQKEFEQITDRIKAKHRGAEVKFEEYVCEPEAYFE